MVAAKEKILLITQYFPPDSAGTGWVMEELAEDLQTAGKEILVLAGRTKYFTQGGYRGYQSKVRVKRIHHFYFNKDFRLGRIFNYLSFPIAALLHFWLFGWADKVIIVSTVPTAIGLAPVIKKIFGKPVYYIWQDIYPDLAIHLGVLKTNSLLARGLRWLNRQSLNHLERIVVLSESMRQYLTQHYPNVKNKLVLITNWENPEEIFPLPKDNPWSRVSGYHDKFVVLYSGNIGLFQNFDPIMEAAEWLKNDREIIFLLVGEGGSKKQLQKISRQKGLTNVDFMSYVDSHDYNYLLASADCHLISLESGMERFGFPGKVYSSLAAGRPIIAISDQAGELARLVRENKVGLVAPTGSEVATAINKLKTNSALANQLGHNSRQLLINRFARRDVTRHYIDLFT